MLKTVKVNVLSTIVKYHEDTAVFIDLYGKLKKGSSSSVLGELKTFTNTNLIKHFLIEETVVFPCIVEKIPATKSLIDNYMKEHQEILSEIYRIVRNDGDNLATATEEVLRKLLGHTIDEDKNINKLIERHSHLQLIMGRVYLLNKQKLQDTPTALFIKKN